MSEYHHATIKHATGCAYHWVPCKLDALQRVSEHLEGREFSIEIDKQTEVIVYTTTDDGSPVTATIQPDREVR